MSRSTHHLRQMQQQQHQQQLLQQQQQQQQMAEAEAAGLAAEIFDHFCVATTMRQVLGLYRNMCDAIGLRPSPLNEFYPKLKTKIRNWKAAALWKKFDARASHRVYNKGNACTGTRVLVIGAGPCGLRTAIEAQLLGAKVVVIEKRDRISRNNVLHLWPFVITDLRNLGAKKFYGKFCAGSIDHISIRQLQCILLKVALLLGVEIHEGVSFENIVEPSDGCGWRARVSPEDHAVSHYEFDVLIGADGKRNTLEGFKRKEFRGKLAIAITANFINKKTEAEAKAEEISGVAFIFNQSFFKELYQTTGIDLENIVYYKDETHYFVMTAKKHSLIDKGVIIQDYADPAELLSPLNVNTDKLLDYAREAAEFSTKYQMPNLEFAVNHYGKPDVAMFDFTSMFAAESSCRVTVRKNYRLLQCLVGDSLLEPFWPTGSGCARGFLSSMDSAYAIKLWSNPKNSILGVLAQRESIYRLLAQTTPENLQRDIGAYTLDPATRYPNLNKSTVNVWQVKNLLDTDDKALLEQTYMDTSISQGVANETPIRRKRRSGDTLPLSAILLRWIKAQLHAYEFTQHLNDVSDVFTSGKVFVALINRYRPDLVDLNAIKDWNPKDCNELAFKILEQEMGIQRVMSSKESLTLDGLESKIWLNYLEQICEVFRGEIPHVKHPKLDLSEFQTKANNTPDFSNLLQMKKTKSPLQDINMTPNVIQRRSVLDEDKLRKQRKFATEYNSPAGADTSRRAKKRRSHEKSGNIEERQQRLQEIEENRQDRQNRRKLQRYHQTQNFYKSLQMLHAGTLLRQQSGENSGPFEDYSIYLYRQQAPEFSDRVKELERKLLHPDRERGIPSAMPRGNAGDEQFSDRIKSMEQKITSKNNYGAEKKPKDLLRAIGKIESDDWNIREIQKKIEQSKKTEMIGKSREKVPKWSKEQFLARQNRMAKPLDQHDMSEEKFKEIDQTMKNLDKQLRGDLDIGERGKNKVASIAGQFTKKDDTSEEKSAPIPKPSSKVGLVFNKQSKTEKCHFCKQIVYLMERVSAENLILHRSCLKCHHCHTNLRLGAYAFDRDDPDGKFYCTQHYRLPAKEIRPVQRRSRNQKKQNMEQNDNQPLDNKKSNFQTPIRGRPSDVAQLDLLDRGQTPERIEFENIDAMSDGEPSLENIIDENEWTDRNFITGDEEGTAESDLSSSESDSESDENDSDVFEEANNSPIGAQTFQLANEWIGKQRYVNIGDSDDEDEFYDSSEGLIDDADSQTEGEDFKKAREMRRQEVQVLPPPSYLPTDTETEVKTKTIDNDQIITKSDDNKLEKIDSSKIPIDATLENIHDNKKPDIIESVNTKLIELENKGPLKVEIKTIENNLGSRRISTEIDTLNENVYNLNNLIKMNKDIENMQKETIVKNDILKKLSLKEKWLNEMYGGEKNDNSKKVDSNQEPKDKQCVVDKIVENVEKISIKPDLNEKNIDKKSNEEPNKHSESATSLHLSTSKLTDPLSEVAAITEKLQAIKKPKLKKSESIQVNSENLELTELEKRRLSMQSQKSFDKDIGKLLYDVENKFSPTPNRKMSGTLKKIEVKNFSNTVDSIKSQMTTPKISKQASLDLSKYFPNQKQEKIAPVAKNANQKTLKDIDLTKYFPQSPITQRKGSITSNSGSSSGIQSPAAQRKLNESSKKTIPEDLIKTKNIETKPKVFPKSKPNILNRPLLKRSNTEQSTTTTQINNNSTKSQQNIKPDSFDQLDGAMDIKKSPAASKKTTTVKKSQKKVTSTASPKNKKKSPIDKTQKIIKKSLNEDEKIFEEIMGNNNDLDENQSPNKEYQELFHDEKSPSTDVSDKIEKLLKNEKADLGGTRKRKVLKDLSIEEKVCEKDLVKVSLNIEQNKTEEILKNVVESVNSTAKIRKKEDALKSTPTSSNRNSISDLEKTMEYLKSEWRTEATNFLQSKRDSFYSKNKSKYLNNSNDYDNSEKRNDDIQENKTNVLKTQENEVDELKTNDRQKLEDVLVLENANENNRSRSKSGSQILEIEMDVNDDEIDSFLNEIMEEMDDNLKVKKRTSKIEKVNVDSFNKNDNEDILANKLTEKDLENERKINIETQKVQHEIACGNSCEIESSQQNLTQENSSEKNLLLTNPFMELKNDVPTLELPLQMEKSSINFSDEKDSTDKSSTFKEDNVLLETPNVRENKSVSPNEDSIEELFKNLNDDSLVDIQFDSDGEIVIVSNSIGNAMENIEEYEKKANERKSPSVKSTQCHQQIESNKISNDENFTSTNTMEISTLDQITDENENNPSRSDESLNAEETNFKKSVERSRSKSNLENNAENLANEYEDNQIVEEQFNELVNENISRENSSPRSDSGIRSEREHDNGRRNTGFFEFNKSSQDISPEKSLERNQDANKSEIYSDKEANQSTPEDKHSPLRKISVSLSDKHKNISSSNDQENVLYTKFTRDNSNEVDVKHFPRKPLRRQKSTSTSLSPDLEPPVPPQRNRNKSLLKLDPSDIPPSVQDILKNIEDSESLKLMDEIPKKFPAKYDEEDFKKSPSSIETISSREKTPKEEFTFMTEDEYIEQLEKERRKSLIRRDEMYAKENALNPLVLTKDKSKPINLPSNVESFDVKSISKSETDLNFLSKQSSSPPKAPLRSPKFKRNSKHKQLMFTNEDPLTSDLSTTKQKINRPSISNIPYDIRSPSKSLSRSTDNILYYPQRSSKSNNNSTIQNSDAGTNILLERSKMLHDLKEDFINEKISGNNPYLKNKYSHSSSKDKILQQYSKSSEDDENDELISNYHYHHHHPSHQQTHSREHKSRTLHFPTSRRRHDTKSKSPENSYVDEINRRLSNLSNVIGSRNFVDYFKRSPSQPKETHQHHRNHQSYSDRSSKDSCVIS